MRIVPLLAVPCLFAACGSSGSSAARTTVTLPATSTTVAATTTTPAPTTTVAATTPPTEATPPSTTAAPDSTPTSDTPTTMAPPTFDLYGGLWLRGERGLVQAGATLLRAQRHTDGETFDIDWLDVGTPVRLGTVSSIVNDDPNFVAFADPQGGAVVVVTSTAVTPANGLTPEQTTMGITAWSTISNKLLWQANVTGETAVACGQMLLVSVKTADTYDLSALDPLTGTEIAHVPGWGYQLDKSICYAHSLDLDDGWTNLDTGAKTPHADLWEPSGKYALTDGGVFDMSTGTVIFKSNDLKLIDGDLGLAVLFNYDLAVVDLSTGAELWRIPGATLDAVGFDVKAARNGVIFGTTGDTLGTDAKLVTLDIRTGTQLWAGGRWGTADGSDSRIFLDSRQIGNITAIDRGGDTGVSFIDKAPLVGVEGGQPVFG